MKRRSADPVHVWLVMNKALQAIQKYAFGRIQQAGLGDSDFRVLEALLHKGPLPVNTIGPKVNLTPGSISVAVDRLYSKGLVTRVESDEDRRIRIVALSPSGKELIVRIFRKHAADIRRAFAEIPSNELGQFERTLKRVGRHAEELSASEESREPPVQHGGSDSLLAIKMPASGGRARRERTRGVATTRDG